MTVGKLHKILNRLVLNGHGRKPVSIAKDTFTHPLESDGVSVLPIDDVKIVWVPMADDDGGIKENKDGSESMRREILLLGHNAEYYNNLESEREG